MSPRIPRCGVPFLGRVHSTITANGRVYSRCSPQARGNGHFWALRRPHPPIFWIHQVPSPGFTWFSPGFTRPPPAQNWLWPSKCAYTQLRPPSQFYAEKSLEPFAERTSRLTQKEPQALHGKGFDPYTGRASTLIQEEPPHQPRPQLHPQPAPRQGPETSRLNLDDQRKRPVVDQFDVHHRAEYPFFYGQAVGFAQFGGEGGY